MILLIDAGNTRIKLARVSGDAWAEVSELPTQRVSELGQVVAGWQEIQQVWVSNVAGASVEQHIRAACATRSWMPEFITARAMQCGVTNAYIQPDQLGSDRWAALLAAWHQLRDACLVVSCGTATTIDALSAEGNFMGGLILPGLELMQHSLFAATAQLSAGQALYMPFPDRTDAAIFSGAVQASCGAIERQYALLGRRDIPVLLSGGAAEILQAHLKMQKQVMNNLVLQGLLLIAREANKR